MNAQRPTQCQGMWEKRAAAGAALRGAELGHQGHGAGGARSSAPPSSSLEAGQSPALIDPDLRILPSVSLEGSAVEP